MPTTAALRKTREGGEDWEAAKVVTNLFLVLVTTNLLLLLVPLDDDVFLNSLCAFPNKTFQYTRKKVS